MRGKNKVVLITGASAGIGKATARMLREEGWQVYAVARRLEAMEDLAAIGVKTMKLDITDDDQCRSVIEEILRNEESLDALVNNAGYGSYGVLEEVNDAETRRQFDVNIFGLMNLTRLLLPQMRIQRSGRIINISSIGGRITTPTGGWYHATKFALEALSDVLRAEMKPFGVDVVVVQPGNIFTEWAEAAAQNLERSSGNSPYQALLNDHAASWKILGNKSNGWLAPAPPETIGKVILDILNARRPKTRYAAPFHARLFLFMRWIMPDRVFDRIMEKQFINLAKQHAMVSSR